MVDGVEHERLGIGRIKEVDIGAATHDLGDNTQVIAVQNGSSGSEHAHQKLEEPLSAKKKKKQALVVGDVYLVGMR